MPLVSTDIALAVVLGGALGIGVWLLLSLAPRWGAPSLARRIAPYVRDVTDAHGIPFGAVAPAWDVRGALRAALLHAASLLGASHGVQRRLRQAGRDQDAAAFRARQLAWSLGGLVGGGLIAVALAILGRGGPVLVLLPPLVALGAALGCDAELTRAARKRVARIEDELPTVLEFLALCLSAGEGLLDSLRRVSEIGVGELTGELRAVVLAVGTGSPLAESLAQLAARVDVVSVSRAVDQIVAALERGAPLAHVLHGQALDAREDAKRGLIERAGRKEIYMLFPLVFFVLPLSILFAVFPGIFMLRLGIG